MTSRFQIVKRVYNKKAKYAVHEVFLDDTEIIGLNNKPVIIEAYSLAGLQKLLDRVMHDMDEYGVYVEDDVTPLDTIDKQYYDYDTEDRVEDLVDIFNRLNK